MASGRRSDGSGCGGCLAIFGVILAIAAVIAGLISLTAIVDPFSWMPSVVKIWRHCDDNLATSRNECALANRFHGFWLHAVINLVYVVAAGVALVVLGANAGELRDARRRRFGGPSAVARYTTARAQVARSAGYGTALALLPFAVALAARGSVTAEGAAVGGVVGALVLLAVIGAVWPSEPSELELRHRELEAAWRSVRVDADEEVPWDRYAAWADPRGASVEISLIRCRPAARRAGGAPSPFTREVLQCIDGEEVERAASAMEKARALAAERELAARQRLVDEELRAEQRSHDRTMKAIDDAAAADLKSREAAVEREFHAQQEVERRAQAEALAKALRRP